MALGVAALGAAALALFGAGSRQAPPSAGSTPPPTATSAAAPVSAGGDMDQCASCHASVVETYRGHGMSRSVGRADEVTPGTVTNPLSGTRYTINTTGGVASITATTADGGVRRQRIVGRVGAGIFDASWVGTEMDAEGRTNTGRLFFAPVETITGSGLQLAPFETHEGSPGFDTPLTRDCLTCHTLDRPAGPARPFPAHQLGADAFETIGPLTCSACHGDVTEHLKMMNDRTAPRVAGLGVIRLWRLSPGEQRDICARCHLQGDARIDLVDGAVDRTRPIAGQIPVLVPTTTQTDFRFVGQVERLALSECFRASPAMTCTTCHDAHTAVRAQGVESFEQACIGCHKTLGKHTSLTVTDVTGEAPRSAAGCVDCHVRRSQPFDLPHVRTADHFIRRSVEGPQHDIPHRQFAARESGLAIYDDGRLRPALESAAGRRWAGGILAMGLLTMGRFKEAAAHLDAFPPPGSEAARTASAPAGLAPLETSAAFHTVRGYVLMSAGRIGDAVRAFSDAIAIDPGNADARLARARIALDHGDIRGAGLDTEEVIRTYPQTEQPWDLRIEIARRTGRTDLELSAADASTRIWPFNPRTWAVVAALAEQGGQTERARIARERMRALSPSMKPAPAPGATR
jgi:predicted CXXCH cytochrome family protein